MAQSRGWRPAHPLLAHTEHSEVRPNAKILLSSGSRWDLLLRPKLVDRPTLPLLWNSWTYQGLPSARPTKQEGEEKSTLLIPLVECVLAAMLEFQLASP